MSWGVTLPGQPFSVNHMYVNVWRSARNGRKFKAKALSREAQEYFNWAVMVIRAAKPTGWRPEGQIRLRFRLYLDRNIDDDNVFKLITDAVQEATGINDNLYLHCTESKVSGVPAREARVELVVDDDAACCHVS